MAAEYFKPLPSEVLHLASQLKAASEAHHVYETRLGHPDSDWPTWYANFILNGGMYVADNEPNHGWKAGK